MGYWKDPLVAETPKGNQHITANSLVYSNYHHCNIELLLTEAGSERAKAMVSKEGLYFCTSFLIDALYTLTLFESYYCWVSTILTK